MTARVVHSGRALGSCTRVVLFLFFMMFKFASQPHGQKEQWSATMVCCTAFIFLCVSSVSLHTMPPWNIPNKARVPIFSHTRAFPPALSITLSIVLYDEPGRSTIRRAWQKYREGKRIHCLCFRMLFQISNTHQVLKINIRVGGIGSVFSLFKVGKVVLVLVLVTLPTLLTC